jgi:hypothetical protein
MRRNHLNLTRVNDSFCKVCIQCAGCTEFRILRQFPAIALPQRYHKFR